MKNSSFFRWFVERARQRWFGPRRAGQAPPTAPIGAPAVERIEHNVAAAFVIKTLDEFAGRVIKNGGVATRLNLAQHLHDDGRFAAAGVADDLEVLILGAQRNAQHLAA
jgi:hypothetical protein